METKRFNITIEVDGRKPIHLHEVHPVNSDNKIVKELTALLRKYVNHRQRIMTKHGAVCTASKMKAIEKCKNRLSLSDNWSVSAFRKFVILMENDLVHILPGQSSKFFMNDYQFVYDLINWARPRKSLAS